MGPDTGLVSILLVSVRSDKWGSEPPVLSSRVVASLLIVCFVICRLKQFQVTEDLLSFDKSFDAITASGTRLM